MANHSFLVTGPWTVSDWKMRSWSGPHSWWERAASRYDLGWDWLVGGRVLDGGWRELVEPSEWGLFAPVAHRAGGCELAPDIWLRLVVVNVDGGWRELEEPSDRGRFSPDTHRADGVKLSSVIWLGLAGVLEVEELWGWLVVFGSGFRKTGGG